MVGGTLGFVPSCPGGRGFVNGATGQRSRYRHRGRQPFPRHVAKAGCVALLPKQKLAVAALAAAKLHIIVEQDPALGEFAALLSVVNFPSFETQPAYRTDLAALAEKTLTDSSRARANLDAVVKQLEENTEAEAGNLERVLAVTAEETNILWWIFGGRSRDTHEAFEEIADEVIPFVAAKELADLTTLLPGHVAICAFADRVSQTGRAKAPQTVWR